MFWLLTLIFLSSYCFYHFYWKRRKFPPGPIPLPIVGNTLEIIFNPPGYNAFKKWHHQYGPIHTVWLGEEPMVTITDFELIMKTFQKDGETYAGREKECDLSRIQNGGKYGVVNTDGELWQDQRRFALHVLRNFGLGKNLMQERVLAEVTSVIEKIRSEIKNGIVEQDLAGHIDIAVGSIINNLLFGYRFENDTTHEFYELKKRATDLVKSVFHPLVLIMKNHMEIAKHLPLFKYHYYKLKNGRENLHAFFMKQYEEHSRRVDHDSEPTDYVEAFIREKAKREAEGDGEFYSMNQLMAMCSDMWIAGQETTSNTLSWGIIYLIQNLSLQEKLHKELDSVIGSDRLITMDDKPNLHYTSAVVNEIQRISNLVPLNVRHTTTKDVEINGYHIPKGTTIIPQVSVVLYDDQIFPNHEKFDPDRFLDENGKWKRVDELIPFSIGKRQCLGEGLARMELFLFTANIFNQFSLKIVPNRPPSLVRKLGATANPEPFACNVEKRH